MSVRNAQMATLANVSSSASSVTIFAANANAVARYLYNDSTATLYLAFDGSAASTTNFTVSVATDTFYEFPLPLCGGKITGIWASANGAARTTEITP